MTSTIQPSMLRTATAPAEVRGSGPEWVEEGLVSLLEVERGASLDKGVIVSVSAAGAEESTSIESAILR